MKMIQDLLTECGYSGQQTFSFAYHGEKLEWEHGVIPFVSNAGSREGYLLVSVKGRELPYLLKSDFLSEITRELGHQEFYSTDMDRNITLLLLCEREKDEQIDHDAIVRIEDDPYYFKKYVFVYTEKEETAAQAYAGTQEGALSDIIRDYLMSPKRFAIFKTLAAGERKQETAEQKKKTRGRKKVTEEVEPPISAENPEQLVYRFFVDLATKITVLPIHPKKDEKIKFVEDYWDEVLCSMQIDDLAAVEAVVEMESDDIGDALAKWNDLKRIGRV